MVGTNPTLITSVVMKMQKNSTLFYIYAYKPFVICRKNFLFSNTIQGAKASAIIFSINQTTRANGINIFNYLQRLFIKLPETPISQLDQFLHWNNDIFDEFGDYED